MTDQPDVSTNSAGQDQKGENKDTWKRQHCIPLPHWGAWNEDLRRPFVALGAQDCNLTANNRFINSQSETISKPMDLPSLGELWD